MPHLTVFGIRCNVVEITIDVQNMKVFARRAAESLSGSDHDTAIAADQRNLSRFLEVRRDTLADAIPGDARTRPTPD
jgi:hypothetical protein